MLALRLTRAARPAVQLRRLLVAAASAGTGFLLLSCLGYALDHPRAADAAALRLAWCAVPLAATVYLALAVARTDPGTRPRTGLSAVGLGPARLMAISALTTALACVLGSMLALLVFLHLRGDLTGMPFDGAAADFLAADQPLPVPATLTLLALPPTITSAAVALALRPTDPRPAGPGPRRFGRFGAYGHSVARETFGAYARFGARRGGRPAGKGVPGAPGADAEDGGQRDRRTAAGHGSAAAPVPEPSGPAAAPAPESSGPAAAPVPEPSGSPAAPVPGADGAPPSPAGVTVAELPGPSTGTGTTRTVDPTLAPTPAQAPADRAPGGLPWGIALLAAGLAAPAYANRSVTTPSLISLPGDAVAVLLGWVLTAAGLVLAAPGLTDLCGRLLQSARPGALRLLAGRVLMSEAGRIGRPLGVVCAVASAGYAMTALYDHSARAVGPLTTLGALLVGGCTVATLLTAAVEARQCRAGTTAALLRLGAPATMLRGAAALRAAALLAVFAPLTLVIATLAALPLTR
ncbi:hypothetical protein ACGFT2_16080 [Streptomyces sp. NPDC048514]|uniref:hypothetical protein n=1 Tax=Streptomyces sp. NPDC048514 TaxID=3365564 RepID=UPI00371F4485